MNIFIGILTIIIFSWGAGRVFEKFGLPLVLGELLVGILLAPFVLALGAQFLGLDSTFLLSISSWLLSEQFMVLSDLSIFFLMFLAGLDMDPWEILRYRKTSFVIAILGMLIPFALGFAAIYFWGSTIGLEGTTKIYAGLIFGICLSMTSIALKTRMLLEEGFLNSRISKIMIGAAVFDDLMALVMFTIVYDIVRLKWLEAGTSAITSQIMSDVFIIILKIAGFFAIVLILAYYVYPVIYKKIKAYGSTGFTFTLVTGLIFTLLAELAGLHFIMGAYIAGLFISKDKIGEKDYKEIKTVISAISVGFLAPFFFVGLGVRFDIAVLSPLILPFLLVTIFIAVFGKTIGSVIGGFLTSLPLKDSLIIGIAMNNRSLLELIIAEIGLQMGILPPILFSVVVAMVFITTFLTPIFSKLVELNLVKKSKLKILPVS